MNSCFSVEIASELSFIYELSCYLWDKLYKLSHNLTSVSDSKNPFHQILLYDFIYDDTKAQCIKIRIKRVLLLADMELWITFLEILQKWVGSWDAPESRPIVTHKDDFQINSQNNEMGNILRMAWITIYLQLMFNINVFNNILSTYLNAVWRHFEISMCPLYFYHCILSQI